MTFSRSARHRKKDWELLPLQISHRAQWSWPKSPYLGLSRYKYTGNTRHYLTTTRKNTNRCHVGLALRTTKYQLSSLPTGSFNRGCLRICGKITDVEKSRFETGKGVGGIFLKSSRFNHACHPHATCTYGWDEPTNTLTFTTLMEVKKGEEITISYTNKPRTLHENYGFDCDCPRCFGPKALKGVPKKPTMVDPKFELLGNEARSWERKYHNYWPGVEIYGRPVGALGEDISLWIRLYFNGLENVLSSLKIFHIHRRRVFPWWAFRLVFIPSTHTFSRHFKYPTFCETFCGWVWISCYYREDKNLSIVSKHFFRILA